MAWACETNSPSRVSVTSPKVSRPSSTSLSLATTNHYSRPFSEIVDYSTIFQRRPNDDHSQGWEATHVGDITRLPLSPSGGRTSVARVLHWWAWPGTSPNVSSGTKV